MKTFVTFGSAHVHRVNGKTFDKDCVAVIESESSANGRAIAFELFGPKFCFEYPEEYFDEEKQEVVKCWDDSKMKYFPRGYIEAN